MNAQTGNWESFEDWLGDLRSEVGSKTALRLIFRGQGDSRWPLTTTLERTVGQEFTLVRYLDLVCSIAPAARTFTSVEAPEYRNKLDLAKELNGGEAFLNLDRFPAGDWYEYLVYLRHHGFPSPFLDWSQSPYVAAFFAFRERAPETSQRSIYVYCESLTGTRGYAVGEPTIRVLGPYVRSHPRHFRQQSTYTVCESLDDSNNLQFDSHQKVFEKPRPEQDLLWRFDLPSDERTAILRRLNEFNLNAYSLFDSEESLFESLWNKEYLFRI